MKTITSPWSLLVAATAILIGYKLVSHVNNINRHPPSPFERGNIIQCDDSVLSLSTELTTQITTIFLEQIAVESDDLADLDGWSLLFYSICCESSLFRRRIWEKSPLYVPLSSSPRIRDLLLSALPTLSSIDEMHKLFEYELLYESANNFFIESNLLLCVLALNPTTRQKTIDTLSQLILDVVHHDANHHFRRSIPFGFNVNEGDEAQIGNRVRNLTNSLYDMKRKFDEREGKTAKRARIEQDC